MKYNTLIRILDKIAAEAPKEYKKYKKIDQIDQIRSKCMIHLYLMVRFGLHDFIEREKLITEGSNDGGIDAYFIDRENKEIFIIQSKFRTTEENFETKDISIEELVKMEIGRIIKGETTDTNGNNYNGKILGFQREISETPNLGLYEYKVILLCNLNKYKKENINRLVENFNFEIFNFKSTYEKLVFPLLTSTYFDPDSLDIKIILNKKNIPYLQQEITTKHGEFDIIVIFVPTYEIAKAMSKYKNALLVYNPRNYLSLAENDVNQEIRKSIVDYSTGEFAIFNNGLTIFADSCGVNSSSGRKDEGMVTISRPQIINGGQTAFTLSKLFEEKIDEEKFRNKEVMLKIITPNFDNSNEKLNSDVEIIKKISKSTNQQSKIMESDMKSNETIQVNLQKLFFSEYGALYERKKGEFQEAVDRKLIMKNDIIKRDELIKAYWSYKGNPGLAKNYMIETIFEKNFNKIFDNIEDIDKIYLSHILYKKISLLEKKHKKNDYNSSEYGLALRYGKNAIIYMYALKFSTDIEIDNSKIDENLNKILSSWKEFEEFALNKNENLVMVNYYKNSALDRDLKEYVSKNTLQLF